MDPTSRRLFMGSGAVSGFFIAATTGPPTNFPYNYFNGAMTSMTQPPAGAGTMGTFLRTTITVGATTYTVRGIYDVYYGDLSGGAGSYSVFAVDGNRTGTWWTNITVNNITYSRTVDFTNPTGTYNSTDNVTHWQTPALSSVFPNVSKNFSLNDGVIYNLVVT